MNKSFPLALAVSFALTACGARESNQPANSTATLEIKAVKVGEVSYPCLQESNAAMRSGNLEIEGALRKQFMTDDAIRAGVRAWVTERGREVTYTDGTDSCFLWMETMSLEEYGKRMGLSPVSVKGGDPAQGPVVLSPKPVDSRER